MPSLGLVKAASRMDAVEEKLAEGYSPRQVASALAREWGVKRRQAQRYVRLALKRWEAESAGMDREEKRAHMRDTLWSLYRTSQSRKRQLISNRDGTVHEFPDPDIKGGEAVLANLCRLDSLLEQPDDGDIHGWRENALTTLHLHYYGQPPPQPGQVIDATPQPDALPSGDDDT